MRIPNPSDVLLGPVVSEKSYGLLDENKIAVEEAFKVKVTGVNTSNRAGKRVRTKAGFGKRPDSKRAIVSLKQGDRIDIFGGPVA